MGAIILTGGWLAPPEAEAYGYSVSTQWQENAQVQDLKNNASPGNFHLYLTPVAFYLGRVMAVGGGAGFDWEIANNFAVRAEGYYPYYLFDRDDRLDRWWRAEAGFRLHTSQDNVYNDEIDIHSSSSSTRVGDYVYTQSSRKWVDRAALHRITHGLSAGMIAQRSPAKVEIAGQEAFPLMTELVVYAGYSYTDSMERSVYVAGYGNRGKAYFQRIYADLLLSVLRDYADVEPDDKDGIVGFRGGIEAIYAEDFGLGSKFEFGMNPGRAQGWYMMVNLSLGLNAWLGPRR